MVHVDYNKKQKQRISNSNNQLNVFPIFQLKRTETMSFFRNMRINPPNFVSISLTSTLEKIPGTQT